MFDVLVREQGALRPDGRPCSELAMMVVLDADATVEVGWVVLYFVRGLGLFLSALLRRG